MLKLKGITKTYISGDEKVEALKGIDIEFRKSEFVSILGQSGCGKTTLLNIIGGLDRYTSGDLIINGKSTKDFKDRDWDSYRNSIGYGENQGVEHSVKSFEEVSKTTESMPNWYKKGVEYALLAPTAMNQQKFTFELINKDTVKVVSGKGFFTKVDLGIVKYHFELGAGKENFKWTK